MIKQTAILLILLTTSVCGFSQETDSLKLSKNAIYVELLGSAGYIYNVSYDRIIYKHNKQNISVALGVQHYLSYSPKEYHQTISPQINYLWGLEKNFLELGVGYYCDFQDSSVNSLIMRVGYRYQQINGLFFKIAATPIITKSVPFFGTGLRVFPWGGIALGYAF